MRRRPVLVLCAAGLIGLSCQVPDLDATRALPHVSAAPPLLEADAPVASTASAPAELEDGPPTPSPAEAAILAELRQRHTALAQHELAVLARTIVEEAERHAFDPALVMAVILVESGGYHLAVSHVGALGLMQLMPPTGEELARKLGHTWQGPESLFDPVFNVKLGVAYLRELSDRYDYLPTALAAYNWGPGRIDRKIRVGAAVPSDYSDSVIMRAYGGSDTPRRRS